MSMKEGLSEIVCIIDRSGSMGAICNDAIGGFNTFLEGQKQLPGEATLTYVQFNDKYEIIHENKPLKDVKPINKKIYVPDGTTALLDAVGKTIDAVGKRLANTPEENRPEKVIVAILTDGEENSSHHYELSSIKSMIEHQRSKYSWEFIFLAANQDAFDEAEKIGIDRMNAVNFDATGAGVKVAYAAMYDSVSSHRKRKKSKA